MLDPDSSTRWHEESRPKITAPEIVEEMKATLIDAVLTPERTPYSLLLLPLTTKLVKVGEAMMVAVVVEMVMLVVVARTCESFVRIISYAGVELWGKLR